MAEYDLTGIRLNGERILFDSAHLQTIEGQLGGTWSMEIDGAHILAPQVNDRVTLEMTTEESRRVQGEAIVMSPGHHDETTKVYDDVEFVGLGPLTERS